MRPIVTLLIILLSAPVGAAEWLKSAAGSLGYHRCTDMLALMGSEGLNGVPIGKNLESAGQFTNKFFLGGFVATRNGDELRHHSFSVGENQHFMCEGRMVTTYVADMGCTEFSEVRLSGARYLGKMADGAVKVYENKPYQLYLGTQQDREQCLVTGIRRFGKSDLRSECAYADLRGGTAELCLLFRAAQAPILSLKLNDEPVFTLREDMTEAFALKHPDRSGETVTIRGNCRAVREAGRLAARVCDLSWAGEPLFEDERLGRKP